MHCSEVAALESRLKHQRVIVLCLNPVIAIDVLILKPVVLDIELILKVLVDRIPQILFKH